MPEPLAHIATERMLRALLTKLDEAAGHIHAMGCTCNGQCCETFRCVGWSTARQYWQLTNRIRRRAGVQEKPR